MKRIVELKERGYADKDKDNYAPVDFEDAMDSYDFRCWKLSVKSVPTSLPPMPKA